MDKLCLQCQQKLSFMKAVRGELFCSSHHRELYLKAEATLAFERVAFFDNPSHADRETPQAPSLAQTVESQAVPTLEDPPSRSPEAPVAQNPAPSRDASSSNSEETAPTVPKPAEMDSIATAKPRRRIRTWLASSLAILVLGAIFFGPTPKSSHSWLPHVSQPLSAAEQDAIIARADSIPRHDSVVDAKLEASGEHAALPASPSAPEAPGKTQAAIPASLASAPMRPAASEPGIRHVAAIRVTDASWVAACSDGKEVLRRVLANGDSRDIEFSGTAIVRTGNAGRTQILVDGKPIGPLGPAGALRIVELAPHGFQLLSLEPGDNGHDCRNN